MKESWRLEDIFIGRGGDHPGVSRYDIGTGEVEHMWSLPVRESVYALAISSDGDRLVAGTKNGLLYNARREQVEPYDGELGIHKITHGFPILATCFVDGDTVAVSDLTGRCLLWQLETTPTASELRTGGAIICGLFRLGTDRLAGLTLAGSLLVWRWPTGEIQLDQAVQGLPRLCALVKPIYWAPVGAWVWAGANGRILLYFVDRDDLKTIEAHEGEVYAVAVCGEDLVTVGRDDGTLKRWTPDSAMPSAQYNAPLGVIALTGWMDSTSTLLLVNDHGAAGLYDLSGDALGFISGIRGRGFRVVLGPDEPRLALLLRNRRMRQAQEISDQIRQGGARSQSGQIEGWHRRLITLGYEHQSFALRAEAARQDEDLVAELRYSRQAVSFVSETVPGAHDLLHRYMSLLVTVWQLPAAEELCNRLVSLYPSDELLQRRMRLGKYVVAMESGDHVIESSVPLRVLAQSAGIMEVPFRGRYLLRQGNPFPSGVPGITPSLLLSRYQRISSDSPETSLPLAIEAVLPWLSTGRIERTCMALFQGGDVGPVPGLEFGLKFYDAGLQTVFVPVALFNADAGSPSSSVEEHNAAIRRRVDLLNIEPICTGWLDSVKSLAFQAVQTLINQKRAKVEYFVGDDHETAAEQKCLGEPSRTWAGSIDGSRISNRAR